MEVERRRRQRVVVEADLRVLLPEGLSVTLIDMGPGGFSVSSDRPIQGDHPRTVRFVTSDEQWWVDLDVTCVYSTADRGGLAYRTGFAFLYTDRPGVQALVRALLGRVLKVLV